MNSFPFQNRCHCRNCGKPGLLKIIVNDKNRNNISEFIEKEKLRGITLEGLEINHMVSCVCQYCFDVNEYFIRKDLFVDGVIKEI